MFKVYYTGHTSRLCWLGAMSLPCSLCWTDSRKVPGTVSYITKKYTGSNAFLTRLIIDFFTCLSFVHVIGNKEVNGNYKDPKRRR